MRNIKITGKNFLKTVAVTLATIMTYEVLAIPMAQASMLSQTAPLSPAQSVSGNKISNSINGLNSKFEPFRLPASVGTIVESYAPNKSGRLVYHLQDVHNHAGAQTNLAEMVSLLESYAAKQGKNLVVAIEGATGDINTDLVAKMPNQEAKENVGAALLNAGYMLGEEYAAITHAPGRIKIVGVEMPGLYKENQVARAASKAERARVLKVVRETRKQLDTLKQHNFSGVLTALEKKRVAVEEGTMPMTEYISALNMVNRNVVSRHPHMARLVDLHKRESQIDFSKVEKEGKQLVQEVMANKSEKEVEQLAIDAQALKEGRISPLSYYSMLLKQSSRNYPEIQRYTAYLAASEQIDPETLFTEVDEASAQIAVGLIRHKLALQLYQHIRYMERLEKFFSLNLIPQEWDAMRRLSMTEINFKHSQIRSFVSEQTADLGYKFTTPYFDAKDLIAAVKGARGFYTAAEARNAAMVANLNKVLNANPSDKSIVAFVAGGFHTVGLTKIFRGEGLAYEVIRPQLDTEIELSQEIKLASRKVDYLRQAPGMGVAPEAVANAVQKETPAAAAQAAENINQELKKPEGDGDKGGSGGLAGQLSDLAKKASDPTNQNFSIGLVATIGFVLVFGLLHIAFQFFSDTTYDVITTIRQKWYLSRQLAARDQHYLDFLNKEIRNPEFQDYAAEAYPALINNDNKRNLPQLLQDLFNIAHDTSKDEQTRQQAGKSFQDVVSLTTSIRDIPKPGDTPESNPKQQVSFDTPLVSASNLTDENFDFIQGIHERFPWDSNQPLTSAPTDGAGQALPASKFLEEVRKAEGEVVDLELDGKFVTRISMGGNARRFGLPEDFPAAMLDATSGLETLKNKLAEQGKAGPVPNMPFHSKVPVDARFIIARLSYIFNKAKEQGRDIRETLDKQEFWLEISQQNSRPIIDYIVKNNFFGLPAQNFVFTEQESVAGYPMVGGQFVQLSWFTRLKWWLSRKKIEIGSQGHGAMEDRGRVPHAAFTIRVGANGRAHREYLNVSAYERYAANDQLVSHFQLSMNHAVLPSYWEDTSHHAIGLAGSRLGLNTFQFRLDPTSTKGGTLATRADWDGNQILESSVLKGPRGAKLIADHTQYRKDKGFKLGVINAGVIVVDPKIELAHLQSAPYHNPILTARGVKGSSDKVDLLNPMVHLDLWRYEEANRFPSILYITDKWKRFEAKDQDALAQHIEFLVKADDPATFPVNFKALEDLRQGRTPFTDLAYYESENFKPQATKGAVVPINPAHPIYMSILAIPATILPMFFGVNQYSVTASAIIAVIGVISLVLGVYLAKAARQSKPMNGMKVEGLIGNARFGHLKQELILNAVNMVAKVNANRKEGEKITLDIKPGILAHIRGNTLNVGTVIFENGVINKISLAHEYVHLTAWQFPTVTNPVINFVFYVGNEVIAWSLGLLYAAFIPSSRLFGRQNQQDNTTSGSHAGSVIDRLAEEGGTPRGQFVTGSRGLNQRLLPASGAANLILNIGGLDFSAGREVVIRQAVQAAEKMHEHAVRAGQDNKRQVSLLVMNDNPDVAADEAGVIAAVESLRARLGIQVGSLSYETYSSLSATDQADASKLFGRANIGSNLQIAGQNGQSGNVFMLTTDPTRQLAGVQTVQVYDNFAYLAVLLYVHSRFAAPDAALVEYVNLISQIIGIKINQNLTNDVEIKKLADMMA